MKLEVRIVNLKRLFNKAIILNNLKRFWWVSVLYTLGLFLISPLVVLTKTGDLENIRTIRFDTIFEGTVLFLFVVPVFLGVIVFRYIQNQKAMVTMHAMPYNRLHLYVNNVISGLILLVTPIVLNTAFLSYIELFVTNGIVFETGIVMDFLWVSLLVSITLYACTVLVGMFTGSSIAQIIFTYILNFLPVGIVVLLNYALNGVIFGFAGVSDNFMENLLKVSPIVQAIDIMNNVEVINSYVWWDALFVVISLVIGYFVYRYRNLEDAGEVISGKLIKPIFKYGVTVCVMLAGVCYIKGIFRVDVPNLLIYILFALLGYTVSEMLLRKSFKVLNSYKGFVGFVGVFAIIVGFIHFDVFGYEDYVPDINDVECFAIDSSSGMRRYVEFGDKSDVLFSQANIEKVIHINQNIVDNKEKNRDAQSSTSISYRLKNGRIINRNYPIDYEEHSDAIKEIYSSDEYKMAQVPLYNRDNNEIDSIRIENAMFSEKYYTVLFSREDINQFVEIMKGDILEYEENIGRYNRYTMSGDRNLYRVQVVYKDRTIDGEIIYERGYLYFTKKSINVCEFIESKFPELIPNVDDIAYIEVEDGTGERNIITNRDEIRRILDETVYYRREQVFEDDIRVVVTKEVSTRVVFNDGISTWI